MERVVWQFIALLVLCGVTTAYADPPSAEPASTLEIRVDPTIVGIWQTVARTYAGQVTYNLEISSDGGYRLAPNSGLDGETGIFNGSGGQWRMTSSAGRRDSGKYELIGDSRIRLTGGSGAVEWTLASRKVKPNPAAAQKTADGLPVLGLSGIPVAANPRFDALIDTATTLAKIWDANAALCRADVIGSYSHARPRFTSFRFVFFRPDDSAHGFEAVFDPGSDAARMFGSAYPFTDAKGMSAAPRHVIDPAQALRRLWDLEPSVPPDQICLQLIKPGVEQPLVVDADRQAGGQRSSYPRAEFMQKFIAPIGDNESNAPRDRFVWRMLAVRNFDAPVGQPYASFVYLDAASGRPLSPRGPAVRGADLAFLKVPEGSPVPVFDFDSMPADKAIPTDGPAFAPATFELLAARQQAESLVLGLRELVAEGAGDAVISATIGRVGAWSARVDALHAQADEQGVSLLENAARRDPHNVALQAQLAHRYVDEVVKERLAMLHPLPPVFRFDASTLVIQTGASVVLDPNTATWLYSFADFEQHAHPQLASLRPAPSKWFTAASSQLTNVLAMDPSQPLACVDLARLQRMETISWDDQYAACEKAMRADPASAMANALFAEYPAQWNQDKLDQASSLRKVSTWYSTQTRFIPNGWIMTTYKNYAYPSATEIAGAEQATGEAQQMQTWAASLRDHSIKLAPLDPLPYFMCGRALGERLALRDRIACDGLLADPGNSQLHALRGRTYEVAGNQAVLQAVSDAAITFDDPYNANTCIALCRRVAAQDAFTSYCAALQAVRLAPVDPMANFVLAAALEGMDGYTVDGVEIMPDAREQARLQYAVAARVGKWAQTQAGANAASLRQIITSAQNACDRLQQAID
jgi:hypothetical protein